MDNHLDHHWPSTVCTYTNTADQSYSATLAPSGGAQSRAEPSGGAGWAQIHSATLRGFPIFSIYSYSPYHYHYNFLLTFTLFFFHLYFGF